VNNGSQDMPMGDMPPMDMQPDMGNDMGGDFMPQGDDMGMMPQQDGGGMPSDFDTNFDAGVEADEEQDPKRYIQQLTGKLSQTLQKYNNDNGQPDVDLNKYVAGMITKQAMKGLSEEDANEIIEKVKADEDFSMDGGENQGMEDMGGQDMMPQDGGDMGGQDMGMMPQDGGGMQQPQMNETLSTRRISKQIDEICRSIFNDRENKQKLQKPKQNQTSHYRNEPFGVFN